MGVESTPTFPASQEMQSRQSWTSLLDRSAAIGSRSCPQHAQLIARSRASATTETQPVPNPVRTRPTPRRGARQVLDLSLAPGEDLHTPEAHTDLGVPVEVEQALGDQVVAAAPATRDRRSCVVVTYRR